MELVLAGNKLQRCRTAFLDRAAHSQSVLILGEGNGRFLLECRRRFKQARITCVDSSRRMLDLARARLEHHRFDGRHIEFVHADALEWRPPGGAYDAVVTHFFLDCFAPRQLEQLVAALAFAGRPKAVWLLADFCLPVSGPARVRAQLIHRLMYGFFRATCRLSARLLTPPDPFLRAHGFLLQERLTTEWGLLHSDEWRRS